MLGKLFKHEFKSQYVQYCGMYIFVILLSVIFFVFDKLHTAFPQNVLFTTLMGFAVAASVIGLIALYVVTFVFSILRYRNNLIKDEGYLMHTLPVAPINLHLTKLITSVAWFAADFLVMILCIAIMSGDWKFSWVNMIVTELELAGLEITWLTILKGIFYVLLSVLSSLSMFYACLNLGSLSYGSKGVMAFVSYIVLYMIAEVINFVIMFVYMFIYFGGSWENFLTMAESEVPPMDYISSIFGMAYFISILFIVGYNVISVYILSKKVNLE